jgi:hypothetical protein
MRICTCNQPGNPDEELIGCTTADCGKWMHKPCIKHEALMRTYEALGKDKPHVSAETKDKPAEPKEEEVKRPLSPTEPGAAGLAQDSIGVAPADAKDEAPSSGKKDAETEENGTGTPVPGSARKGRPRKHVETNGVTKASGKPYEGLFDVEIQLETTPPQLTFRDLRENIEGGDKEWSEPLKCLLCGNPCT